jgi:hypothetical protein
MLCSQVHIVHGEIWQLSYEFCLIGGPLEGGGASLNAMRTNCTLLTV